MKLIERILSEENLKEVIKKVKEVLRRKYAASRPLSITFTKLKKLFEGGLTIFEQVQ